MKKIGIIGGLELESTIDYYKGIINAFRQREVDLIRCTCGHQWCGYYSVRREERYCKGEIRK